MERAVALETGDVLTPASLPERVLGEMPATQGEPELVVLEEGADLESRLAAIERRYLEQALAKTNGNRTKAAALLGITFRSFRYRLARFGMDPDSP